MGESAKYDNTIKLQKQYMKKPCGLTQAFPNFSCSTVEKIVAL